MSEVELAALQALQEPKGVAIGTRWVPEQVLRVDTYAGTFEHVNPMFTDEEKRLQDLLCARPAVRERSKWNPLRPRYNIIRGVEK